MPSLYSSLLSWQRGTFSSCLGTLCLGALSIPFTIHSESPASEPNAEALFAHKIWPTITTSCLACHGDDPQKLKGGLDLRTREGALRGGDYGAALVPGKPAESPILTAIEWTDEDLQMPPKKSERLPAETVERFREWIQSGAPWPNEERIQELLTTTEDQWSAAEGVSVVTSGGLKDEWTQRKYLPENLWAYQPLNQPDPPLSNQHPIDSFIGQKLLDAGLEAAPLADRHTLIKRASYDLTGLPPQPDDVERFLADPRSDEHAFADVVERLLGSSSHFEEWSL